MKKTFILTMLMSMFFLGAWSDTKNNPKVEATGNPIVVNHASIENTVYGYDIGDIATDFSLLNIDGKMVSLSDFPDAKGFIITFTCNHCPYAVAYEDRLIALDKKYKEKGYPVIAINPNNQTLIQKIIMKT